MSTNCGVPGCRNSPKRKTEERDLTPFAVPPFSLSDTASLPPGLQIVPFDITLDGKPSGELFDFLVQGKDSKQP